MKKLLFVVVLCVLTQGTSLATYFSAPDSSVFVEDENPEANVYTNVPVMPSFPRGEKGLKKFIHQNLNVPQESIDKKINKNVYVSFIVEKDGEITNINLLNSVGHGCDKAALELVNSMPSWKPGKLKGKKVRVEVKLAIPFRPAYYSGR